MKGAILKSLIPLLILGTLVNASQNQDVHIVENPSNESALLLADFLLNIDLNSRVTVHSGKTVVTRDDIRNKYKNQQIGQCYDAIWNFTMHMREGHYKKMALYSFSDIGDVGDYDGGVALSEYAEYNYMNVNLTKLPIDVRSGLGFPKEGKQWMMDKAADPLSETAYQIIQAIGWATGLEFVKKYQVGAEISFIQPNAWRETQVSQRSIGAIVVLSFMAVLAFFVISLSILLHLGKSDQNSGKENINIIGEKESLLIKEDDFGGISLSNDHHHSIREFPTLSKNNGNTNNFDPLNFGFSPRKLTSPKNQLSTNYTSVTPRSDFVSSEASTDVFLHKKQPEVQLIVREKYKGSFFSNIVAGFSLQRNIFSLHKPINKFEDDEDLAFIDGMRVLTMFWVILALTAVYCLIGNLSDPIVIFSYFSGYPFAMLSAGFITPELFIFYIFFLGFIYMARFYDMNGGIGFTDYIRFYIHRFLKLAPMYYLVFFFTWFVYPLIFTSPGWFVSERFSTNGETEWPFVLTFLNNLIPFFTQALNGCYYWPYVVPNDMLLHIFFPLLVILYKKRRKLFYLTTVAILIGGFLIDFIITLKNKLRVGILTFEDYYLFACFYNKPYTKLPILSGGMAMGAFYLRLIKYRKAPELEKKKEYYFIHFMHTSWIFTIFLYAYSFGIINFINFIQVSSNKNGYSWTMDENGFFFAFSRFGYISGIIAIIVNILIGRGKYIKVMLSYYCWRPLSRLTFTAYLIFPLVIGAAIFDTRKSLYATYSRAAISMMSGIILTYVFALFVFLLFEKPMENLKNYLKYLIFGDESLRFIPKSERLETISEKISKEDFKKKGV